MKAIRRAAVLAASLAFAFASPSIAQEAPLVPGEYVDVSSVTIDDGHNLDYANFLAGYWRAQQDFMKAQGWITSYEILANIHKRPGEPDLYLVQRSKSLPDGAESQRRDQLMRDKMKMTEAQMEASSGERAKFRHVIGGSLMQVLDFRK
jgi:hypothetical protein